MGANMVVIQPQHTDPLNVKAKHSLLGLIQNVKLCWTIKESYPIQGKFVQQLLQRFSECSISPLFLAAARPLIGFEDVFIQSVTKMLLGSGPLGSLFPI